MIGVREGIATEELGTTGVAETEGAMEGENIPASSRDGVGVLALDASISGSTISVVSCSCSFMRTVSSRK